MDVLRHYWHPVCWAADLGSSPMTTLLLGSRVVLWRDLAGHPVAAADRCPHRGTALSLGRVDGAGCVVCPYHGWTYDASGVCTRIPQLAGTGRIPPRARLEVYCCEERNGLVWVALDDPAAEVPAFPEWHDPSYRHVACPAYTWRTGAARMVENFTDFGHLGYLHDGLLGSGDDLVVPAHRVEHAGGVLRYSLTMQAPNTDERFGAAAARGPQTNTYVLSLPYSIHLQCTYHDTGAHRTVFFTVQPHGDGTCTGYWYQSRDYDLDAEDAPFAAFQELLVEEDRPIVESQLPAEVPLDPADELHLPFDRVAFAYRRALAQLFEPTPVAEAPRQSLLRV